MEKYGVQIDDEKTKTASEKKKCPKCGAELSVKMSLPFPVCLECGTEPFEKRKKEQP